MDHTAATFREVAVPVSIFDALRRELSKEAGALPTIHALHAAGFASGSAAAEMFQAEAGGDLGEEEFWARFAAFFQRRGWGSLTHTKGHPAVGFLESLDWVEAENAPTSDDASCSFSSGFLSGLLSAVAGGAIAVLEVSCRARGEGSCRFAFGSESTVHELYGKLLEDVDLDRALSDL